METSTDRRLATKAETASGDGTSALPCDGGVFSLAARTATGGDGVPRVTTLAVFFFFPEEEDGLGGRAAVGEPVPNGSHICVLNGCQTRTLARIREN